MKKRSTESSLMGNCMRLLMIVFLVIIIAFVCNFVVVQSWYREEAVKSRQTLFGQTAEQLNSMEDEINTVVGLVTSSTAIADYLEAEILGGRWLELSEYKQFVGNIMSLNGNIVGLSLYDEEQNLVASQGTQFAFLGEEYEWGDSVWFSNCIEIAGEQGSFFQVVVPVYEKTTSGTYNSIAWAVLLFQTGEIEEVFDLVISAYTAESSYIAVTDRNEDILVSSGNAQIWENYVNEEEGGKQYLFFSDTLLQSGWEIIYIVGRDSFMSAMSQSQMINLVTYFIIAAVFIGMCYMMYHKVVLPLRRQMNFVVSFTKDTSQRLEVRDKNEFGTLEREMNEMMDGIENLNRQIMEEKERNLKLGYAKKRTELIAYKSQINPHFMHNALECIRGMALYHGEKEIAKLTAAMSRLFQYSVKGEEIVTVKEMMLLLSNYAVIIEYRFMGKIQIQFHTDEEANLYHLPKMLVQPLLENAVHHGVEPKAEKGYVTVKVQKLDESRFMIIVEDDGAGMDENTLERQRRKFREEIALDEADNIKELKYEIGILNVAQRLKLYYGNACEFLIESERGIGSRVTLILPQEIPESQM